MDPLSISAAVIAVGTLVAQVTKAFQNLRAVCRDLPGRLHALNNEVVDLSAVLQEVEAIAAEPGHTTITTSLGQLRAGLQEILGILRLLTNACTHSRLPLAQARQWSSVQRKLLSLQEQLRTQKSHLHIALGVSHSRDLRQIRLDLTTISMGSSVRDQLQNQLQQALVDNTAVVASGVDITRRVDMRLARLEKFMKATEERLADDELHTLAIDDQEASERRRKRSRETLQKNMPLGLRTNAVRVQLRRYNTACSPNCSCACHQQSWGSSPALFDRMIGQLFVDYSGIPMIRPKCNDNRCKKRSSAYLDFEYWFPLGLFWSQIIRFHFGYQENLGPQFQLSTLRRIPDDAPAITFASSGNIDGLRDLFIRGLASPRDVSETRGYSLLRGEARPEWEDELRLITRESDFFDDQDYTLIHEAILGITGVSLEQAILQHPYDLETKDRAGRTPLAWAAARGNEVLVALLLAHGAEPNTFEARGETPLYNASHSGSTSAARCCRLLLEAGAETDPPQPAGTQASPAFLIACGVNRDSLVMKTLIDFGTDVDATAPDGRTALHETAKRDLAERTLMLLEAGASINLKTNGGQTALTIAVTYNSHRVLKLLLSRWYEYSECPRLQGPDLLKLAAMYAHTETITILTETDHLRLMYDRSYSGNDYNEQLRPRPDADEKLLAAFKTLLTIVREKASKGADPVGVLEAGRQHKHGFVSQRSDGVYHVPGSWDGTETEDESSDSENDVFEEALAEALKVGGG